MKSDRGLVAHLMRRAGFGATPSELDRLTAEKTYDEIVDDLVTPERFAELDQSYIDRYYGGEPVAVHVGKWLYRMANTRRPLEEKMSLFLHHIFPVAWGKSEHGPSLYSEIEMFRRVGLTDMRTILLELSRDPAMIFWLDNNENHKDEINENYGRELLELFSMGVGNYTEDDIKAASRAFTGLDVQAAAVAVSERALPGRVRVHRGRSRLRREDVPRRDGQLRRRGRHRHHSQAAGDGEIHLSTPVQLLRRGRGAGAVVGDGGSEERGGDTAAFRRVHGDRRTDAPGAA